MDPIKAALISMLVLTAAQCRLFPADAAQTGDDHMTMGRKTGEETDKKAEPSEEELVITPAGPMRKKNVHQVEPNQAVRRNKDGSYTIVPKPDSR